MNIDDIAIYCVYEEDKYQPLYRQPSAPKYPRPRALRHGTVVWLVKDGQPVVIQSEKPSCPCKKERDAELCNHWKP